MHAPVASPNRIRAVQAYSSWRFYFRSVYIVRRVSFSGLSGSWASPRCNPRPIPPFPSFTFHAPKLTAGDSQLMYTPSIQCFFVVVIVAVVVQVRLSWPRVESMSYSADQQSWYFVLCFSKFVMRVVYWLLIPTIVSNIYFIVQRTRPRGQMGVGSPYGGRRSSPQELERKATAACDSASSAKLYNTQFANTKAHLLHVHDALPLSATMRHKTYAKHGDAADDGSVVGRGQGLVGRGNVALGGGALALLLGVDSLGRHLLLVVCLLLRVKGEGCGDDEMCRYEYSRSGWDGRGGRNPAGASNFLPCAGCENLGSTGWLP